MTLSGVYLGLGRPGDGVVTPTAFLNKTATISTKLQLNENVATKAVGAPMGLGEVPSALLAVERYDCQKHLSEILFSNKVCTPNNSKAEIDLFSLKCSEWFRCVPKVG